MYTKQTVYLVKFEDDTYARTEIHNMFGLCVDSVDLNEASHFLSLEDESDSVHGVYSLIKEMEHTLVYSDKLKCNIELKVKEIEKVEVRTIIDLIETIVV